MRSRLSARLSIAGVLLVGLAACGDGAGSASPDPTGGTPVDTTSGAPSSGSDGPDCEGVFPDLSATPGAGEGYDRPEVTVTCDGDTMTVTSNGMIAYEFVSRTPNGLRAQDYVWTVDTSPQVADQPTSVAGRLGTLGFTVTGIPIFGPMEGPTPVAEAFGDPVYNGLLDGCGGHTGYGADYHYHTILAEAACYLDETIVGYALDGFPIYSNPGYEHRSGWVRTGDPKSNAWDAYTYQGGGDTLDECNGAVGDDGTYRYYVTESFPYVIGCFAGTASEQTGAAAMPMPPMNGGMPPNGGPPPGPNSGPPPTAAAMVRSATSTASTSWVCELV